MVTGSWSLWLALALAAQEDGAAPQRPVGPGAEIVGRVDDADPVALVPVRADANGNLRAELRAVAFDPVLVLRDAEGAVLAEDDDGLFPCDARIALSGLDAGGEYVLEVVPLNGRDGAFTLSLVAGAGEGGAAALAPPLERARAGWKELLASEAGAVELADGLIGLADELQRAGLYAEARVLDERALALALPELGDEHPFVLACHHYVAELSRALGDLERARVEHERALEGRRRLHGAGHAQTSDSLEGLGEVLAALGLYDEARPLLEEALAARRAAVGERHPTTARTLSALARLAYRERDYEDARALYEEALRVQLEVAGPDDRWTLATRVNLAATQRSLGRLAEARAGLEEVLEASRRVWGPEHPSTSDVLTNLANVLRDQGHLAEARPMHERALEIRRRSLPPEHPHTAGSLSNLGLILADLGELDSAWELARRAEREGRVHRVRVGASQPEWERYAYLATLFDQLELRLSLAALHPGEEVGVEAYESLLDWKGRVARWIGRSRARILADLDTEQGELLGRIRRVQAELSAHLLGGPAADAVDRDARLAELREDYQELELAWQRSLAASGEGAASYADLAEALPPGAAAVDLFVHRVYRPATGGAGEWSAPHVRAWVTLPRSPAPVDVDLGPASELEALAREFLRTLVATRGEPVRQASSSAANDALVERLWSPLAELVGAADVVLVSPDGFLGALPFEVLQLPDGSYLIEERAFVYRQDLASLSGSAPAGGTPAGRLIAVGGLDFRRRAEGAPGASAAASPATPLAAARERSREEGLPVWWRPLDRTVDEVDGVAALHEELLEGGGERLVLKGADGTEERLKRELGRHGLVHLATHGFFEPEGLPNMWEEARGEVRLREPVRRVVGSHPGLLSGIVCSGASAPPEAGRDDGYLTAEEVSWLDLSGVHMVVLSACETGLGRPQSGEGFIGLRRAFRVAGADTVVSSLWRVQDESTSDLMTAFYHNLWIRGMGRIEALRSAQLGLLRRARAEHGEGLPSRWGGFVLSGEWR